MTKRILIESCAGCDYCKKFPFGVNGLSSGTTTTGWNYYCEKEHFGVNEYVANETIHPDCPLEDIKSHKEVKCQHCNDIKFYEGDAPLPEPIILGLEGLIEHHCGYKNAPSPRFTFICPKCVPKITIFDVKKVQEEVIKPIEKVLEDYNKMKPIEIDHIKQFLEFKDAIEESIKIARGETND